ncbi:hypothetical protein PG2093B_1733 [Bifidobacterium pseudolongum subsp. globosum]|uniref:Uncharacterized protein n=1 Tax=Bifidobacterium pseudolongum subsp. globosum TaxID=1690 RepID=A0A4Q5A0J5_9BIFI|nr:hypothetical protein PG2093B_1733 [Bifidobacterium pseudolongum subsp. globosum]
MCPFLGQFMKRGGFIPLRFKGFLRGLKSFRKASYLFLGFGQSGSQLAQLTLGLPAILFKTLYTPLRLGLVLQGVNPGLTDILFPIPLADHLGIIVQFPRSAMHANPADF